MRITVGHLLAFVAVALVAGVAYLHYENRGSSTTATPSSPVTTTVVATTATTNLPDLRKKYLQIVAPANKAQDKFDGCWYQTECIGGVAGYLYLTLQKMNDKLLRVDWPANVAVDVKALVRADAPMISDVGDVAPLRFGEEWWQKKFGEDRDRASAEANIVRADLGLTAPS